MATRQNRNRREFPLVSAILFAPLLGAVGLLAMPSAVQSGFVHTPTTSAQYRLDVIAYRARPQVELDYSGYHHRTNH